jgi:hypothetical protein
LSFWNDPDVSVHTLPVGVELDKKCPGHAGALFTDYQFTTQRGWDCGRNKQVDALQANQSRLVSIASSGLMLAENTAAVTAKHTVPRFAERVSAAPLSRGDPRRRTFRRGKLMSKTASEYLVEAI